MATKHLSCNTCGQDWEDVPGEGQCPYCGSLDVEVVPLPTDAKGDEDVFSDPAYWGGQGGYVWS